MTVYFTYHIFHTITKKHYYGARWKPGCHPKDLWTSYFTSSKLVHQLIDEYGADSFVVEIRRVFESKSECISWEQRVLKRLKVKRNDDWLNVAIGRPTMQGKHHSEETKQKMRKPKGPWTSERKHYKRLQMITKAREGAHVPSTLGMKLHMPQLTCPVCGKTGGANGMRRYHFDNCKLSTDT